MNTRNVRYKEYEKLKVGEKIKTLRDKETQRQFISKLYDAGITGKNSLEISVETLKSWELGRTSEIRVSDLMKICNATGCDLDYLVTDQKMKTKEAADIQKLTNLSEDTIDYLMNSSDNIERQVIDCFVTEINNNFDFIHSITLYFEGLEANKELKNKYHPTIYELLIKSMNEFRMDPEHGHDNYESYLKPYFDNIDKKNFEKFLKHDRFYTSSVLSGNYQDEIDAYLKHIIANDYECIYYASNCLIFKYNANLECMKLLERIGERGLKWHTKEKEETRIK